MDGLTWEEFLKQVKDFLNLSLQLEQPWKFEGNTKIPGGAYIRRKDIIKVPENNFPEFENPEKFEESTTQVANDPGELINPQEDASIWREIHVLYNVSYCAPHLLIRAGKLDGSLLQLESLWSILPKDSWSSELHNNLWGSLTPCEHPLLIVPFYSLHPCHTQQWIKEISNLQPSNLLLTWLSSALPFLGLNLPSEYAVLQVTKEDEDKSKKIISQVYK